MLQLATALVRSIYKKHDRGKTRNYRPVSLLNGFSKTYERFLPDSLSNYIDKILSKFVSAYRKSYSSHDALLKLIEEWKDSLNDKMDAIAFIYSYLKRRKQGVKINDTENVLKILLSGVPQDESQVRYSSTQLLMIYGSL